MGWERTRGGQWIHFLQMVHEGLGASGLGFSAHQGDQGDKRKREMGIIQVFRCVSMLQD